MPVSKAPQSESYDLRDLMHCVRCPRLAAHHAEVRRRFAGYHALPVGAWGPTSAKMLIVGLAPGLHGATRTGRAFVGDASGDFLFASLFRLGLATASQPQEAKLLNVRITNVVKCLPPGNAPIRDELANCSGYLRQEVNLFCPARSRRPRVIICLGGVAHKAVCRMLGEPSREFVHGEQWRVRPRLTVLSSYHPSRLNVNTKRLTTGMLDSVVHQAVGLLDE